MTNEVALAQPVSFSCDYHGKPTFLAHSWEHTIGSGHATLGLRADWQAQLRRCHEELGIRYVRFHGLLNDDMGTFIINNGQPLYSFFNADSIFDFLVSIGMKPFVELSFMPTGLASGDKIVFHYRGNVTPPKDFEQWKTLINKLVSHWVERYGVEEVRAWFFEVWNEPNLEAFGTGKQEDYFKLYEATAAAIKMVDAELKIGGPATAMNAWIADFVSFCKKNRLPADFISTHHYPTDAFGKPDDDTETQLAASERSVLRKQAQKAVAEAAGKPVYYTEWSSSSNPRDPLHDAPYAAAFAVKTIMECNGLVEAYSWWTFTDIFEENYFPSVPFHGGFGLLNIHGIAKPVYRAYQLLHTLGTQLLPVEGAHGTVDVWAIKAQGSLTFLITNHALPRHSVKTEQVSLTLTNAAVFKRAILRRIDEDNANAPRSWRNMGQPTYLSTAQVSALHEASCLRDEQYPFHIQDNTLTAALAIPPQGIAALTLYEEAS